MVVKLWLPLGERLKELRVAQGKKQATVARELSKHPSDLSNIESGNLHPSDDFIIKLIQYYGLKPAQAAEVLELGKYDRGLLSKLQPSFEHYPLADPDEIGKLLRGDLGRIPAWRLREDATVMEFNLLSAWLWNALDIPNETIWRDLLLGVCVFEIYARDTNFPRIAGPISSRDMLYVKPPTMKLMEDYLPASAVFAFKERIEASPVLKLIYDHVTLKGEEWKYILKIIPPSYPHFERQQYLEFDVTVEKIVQGNRHTGFLIYGQPVGAYSLTVVQAAYDKIIEVFKEEQFVQHQTESIPIISYAFPSYFPALWLDSLFSIRDENKAHRLLVGESVIGTFLPDLFVCGSLKNVLSSAFSMNTILNVLWAFFRLTEDYREKGDQYHARYETVLSTLFSSPNYGAYLDAFWRRYPPSTFQQKPASGTVLYEVFTACIYAKNVQLAFKSYVYFSTHKQNRYQLLMQPKNAETSIALILLHLEEVCLKAEEVGKLPVEQFQWFLAVLRTLKEGITTGKAETSWTPARAYTDAKIAMSLFQNAPNVREQWARLQIQRSMYELYSDRDTASPTALLEILIGFCAKAEATYVQKFLSEPLETVAAGLIPAAQDQAGLTQSFPTAIQQHMSQEGGVEGVSERKTNGEATRYLTTLNEAAVNAQGVQEVRPYASWYPAFTHDVLFTITGENSAHRYFIGDASFVGRNFFDFLLSEEAKQATGESSDNNTIQRALKYFIVLTAKYQDPAHRLHAQYKELIQHLKTNPEFSMHYNIVWSAFARDPSGFNDLPMDNKTQCDPSLVWPFCPEVILTFHSIACFPVPGRPNYPDYLVTLVPVNREAKAGLILLHLLKEVATPEYTGAVGQTLLQWKLAALRTVQEGLERDDHDTQWQPIVAFRQVLKDTAVIQDRDTLLTTFELTLLSLTLTNEQVSKDMHKLLFAFNQYVESRQQTLVQTQKH